MKNYVLTGETKKMRHGTRLPYKIITTSAADIGRGGFLWVELSVSD